MGARITGTGSWLPARIVTNDEIAASLDTSDEWIFSHTGIKTRHIAGPGESTASMSAEAGRAAIAAAGLAPEDIGMVVVATSTPDYATFPSTACMVQNALGCRNAGAFDIQAACAGFIYALEAARGLVELSRRPALVIGAETLSRIVDWKDRGTCILFGDGAGAAVVEYSESPSLWLSTLRADGSGAQYIVREGGTRPGPDGKPIPAAPLAMKGRNVYNFAIKALEDVTRSLCAAAGTAPAALDCIFAHQANGRIIEAVARRMDLPLGKFYLNIASTGNTSAASIPVALDQAARGGALRDGMRIVLCGFGAGLTFGGTIMDWPGASGGVRDNRDTAK